MLHALWRQKCIQISIATDECWISSGGMVIVEMKEEMDRKAFVPGVDSLPHHLETFDFVAMYNNIFVACLKRSMTELLRLVYEYEERNFGWKSLYVRYGYNGDGVAPAVREVH